jgi:hypothetical protein
MAFSGCPRGPRVVCETVCPSTQRLTSQWRLTLEPERLKNRPATTGENPREWSGFPKHSSCLWFQMLGVERHSFLPDDQRNRRNFARQR